MSPKGDIRGLPGGRLFGVTRGERVKTVGIAKQLTPRRCIDRTAFPQTLYTPPMLVQCWASIADVGLTLKQHWGNVSFE